MRQERRITMGEDNKKHYSVSVVCLNCGCCNDIYVEEGKKTEYQLRTESIKCSHCKLRIKDFKVRAKAIMGNHTSYV